MISVMTTLCASTEQVSVGWGAIVHQRIAVEIHVYSNICSNDAHRQEREETGCCKKMHCNLMRSCDGTEETVLGK